MGLDISIKTQFNESVYEHDFSGRQRWSWFVTFMEHEFDYKYAENMPLTKKIIDRMINELLHHCKELDIFEDENELCENVRMIESLLICRGAIKSGYKSTWEADW